MLSRMTRVFYVDWQMQCCGTPFAVGDTVTWTVGDATSISDWLTTVEPRGVDWTEEHHQEEYIVGSVSGVVERIQAVWQTRAPNAVDPRLLERVEGSQFAIDVYTADGWEDEGDSSRHPGKSFEGYLVTLGQR